MHTRQKQNLKIETPALASVVQWVGSLSLGPKVMGLISSQGTYPGCGFDPGQSMYKQAID